MSVEKLNRAQLARELGYIDLDGNPNLGAVAKALREAMGRWGLCSRRALLKYARDQLRAVDVPADSVPDVLDRLLALGECAKVVVGYEPFIAPAEPRWIDVGGGIAVLLGPFSVPVELCEKEGFQSDDVVVRVVFNGDETATALEAKGARQVALEEWLHPCDYFRHVERRTDSPVRGDQWNLARFWELLVSALSDEGLLLGPDTEFRAVTGSAGSFFGRHTATVVEGRWREQPPDGVWCAYRRAHGENRWLPTLISVDGDERRALDLHDDDEWRWAHLARSKAFGMAEVVRRAGGEEHLTWPLPAQLRAAMDIIGVPDGPWRWRIARDTPDLWALVR